MLSKIILICGFRVKCDENFTLLFFAVGVVHWQKNKE
jgi:hypothetical protein